MSRNRCRGGRTISGCLLIRNLSVSSRASGASFTSRPKETRFKALWPWLVELFSSVLLKQGLTLSSASVLVQWLLVLPPLWGSEKTASRLVIREPERYLISMNISFSWSDLTQNLIHFTMVRLGGKNDYIYVCTHALFFFFKSLNKGVLCWTFSAEVAQLAFCWLLCSLRETFKTSLICKSFLRFLMWKTVNALTRG